MKSIHITLIVAFLALVACQENEQPKKKGLGPDEKEVRFPYRGYNLLSNNRELGLEILDTAKAYGVNYVEMSHYQLCHFLKDLKNKQIREDVNFFSKAIKSRGMDAFVWEHAFYEMSYYPDRFKVEAKEEMDMSHHTHKFEGGKDLQLNLDDPNLWQWIWNDYDSLLSLAPDLDGITLTFIETGSYVLYQHSEKFETPEEKIGMLIDSLAHYFIDKKGLKLHVRTFIYNQFEKDKILNGLKKVNRDDIKVMIKMVPHDWFMSYPYQDYVADLNFPVIIEYDCGGEYAGENIITNSFPSYFGEAFKYYAQYENVQGYCLRTSRFETTTAVGNPGELNLYMMSRLAENPKEDINSVTSDFIIKNYGKPGLEQLKEAFDSAHSIVMASMYTLGTHTANHSRLNFHRDGIYQTHTTGEWYAPDNQMWKVGHGVDKTLHNYKDILNVLAFPKYKTDTVGLKKDIAWVLDSAWLSPKEEMTLEVLQDIITEKQYAVDLAEMCMSKYQEVKQNRTSKSFVANDAQADNFKHLYHVFNRTIILTKERKAVAQAVYGYRLWTKGKEHQSPELQKIIWEGLTKGDSLITLMENYEPQTPKGQWRWHRDRESFQIYYDAITKGVWSKMGYEGIAVP